MSIIGKQVKINMPGALTDGELGTLKSFSPDIRKYEVAFPSSFVGWYYRHELFVEGENDTWREIFNAEKLICKALVGRIYKGAVIEDVYMDTDGDPDRVLCLMVKGGYTTRLDVCSDIELEP